MKKVIELSEEILSRLSEGKYVEGSLHLEKKTKRVVFGAYNRLSRKHKDRVVCQLESGWLKEGAKRYKFYNSVKKELGYRLVNVQMHRELKTAMDRLEVEDLLNRV